MVSEIILFSLSCNLRTPRFNNSSWGEGLATSQDSSRTKEKKKLLKNRESYRISCASSLLCCCTCVRVELVLRFMPAPLGPIIVVCAIAARIFLRCLLWRPLPCRECKVRSGNVGGLWVPQCNVFTEVVPSLHSNYGIQFIFDPEQIALTPYQLPPMRWAHVERSVYTYLFFDLAKP